VDVTYRRTSVRLGDYAFFSDALTDRG
jgi:hypothetical protein